MVVNTSATKELVRERTGRDPLELLRELYVDKRHSDREIAEAFAAAGAPVNRVTITNWRLEAGITRELRKPAKAAPVTA